MRHEGGTERQRAARSEGDDLARALQTAVQSTPADSPAARRAVGQFVQAAKGRGAPPEEVIIALKEELQRRVLPHMRPEAYAEFAVEAVQWAIEEYYR